MGCLNGHASFAGGCAPRKAHAHAEVPSQPDRPIRAEQATAAIDVVVGIHEHRLAKQDADLAEVLELLAATLSPSIDTQEVARFDDARLSLYTRRCRKHEQPHDCPTNYQL